MKTTTERQFAPDPEDPDIIRLYPDGNAETDQMDLFKDEQARLELEKAEQAKAEALAIVRASRPIRDQYTESGVFNAEMAHEIYMHYMGKRIGETPRPEMDLSFLKELNDPEAAAVISKYPGIVNLDGVEHLSWEAANVLNENNAFVFLRGVRPVNERVLRVLLSLDKKTKLVASEELRKQLDALYQKDMGAK